MISRYTGYKLMQAEMIIAYYPTIKHMHMKMQLDYFTKVCCIFLSI